MCYHSLSFYHRPCRPQLRCGGQRHACLCFTCVLISPCIAAFLPAQVLDELGRGTATHDGHAIAYGVALHLAQTKRCRCAGWLGWLARGSRRSSSRILTAWMPRLARPIQSCWKSLPPPLPCSSLFATHYHGLTQEPGLAAVVQLGHMAAAVDPRRGLLPSYRLAPGGFVVGLRSALEANCDSAAGPCNTPRVPLTTAHTPPSLAFCRPGNDWVMRCGSGSRLPAASCCGRSCC